MLDCELTLGQIIPLKCLLPSDKEQKQNMLVTIINYILGHQKNVGAFQGSNLGPLVPEVRIIPLDQMPNSWCL